MAAIPADGVFRRQERARGRGVARHALNAREAAPSAQRSLGNRVVEVPQPAGLHQVELQRALLAVDFKAHFVVGAGGDLAGLHGAQRAVRHAQGQDGVILAKVGFHAAGLCGTGRVQRVRRAHHAFREAADVGHKVERVGSEVENHAALRFLLPTDGTRFVHRAGMQILRVEADDFAQCALLRQLLCAHGGGQEAVVHHHLRIRAAFAGGRGDAPGAVQRDGHGLVQIHVLPGLQKRDGHFLVQRVGRAHGNRVDVVAGQNRAPVGGIAFKAQKLHRFARGRLAARAYALQHRLKVDARIHHGNRPERVRVRAPHKAPADYGNANRFHINLYAPFFISIP